jgi:hypothetical protein
LQLEVGRLLSRVQAETVSLPTRVMDDIVQALRKRQSIRALTETQRGVYANIEILPSRLVATANGWQLCGRSAGDPTERIFDVGSFLLVEVIDRPDFSLVLSDQGFYERPSADCKRLRKPIAAANRASPKAIAFAR